MTFEHRYVPMKDASRTILVLHGTGGDESSLLGIAGSVAPDANLLSPRGKVNEGGMNRFFKRFAEGVFDVEDIKRQAADLATFVIEAAEEYRFDPARVFGLGYSNGANIGTALLLLHPEALAGHVAIRGMVPLEPDPLPNLTGKSVLIRNGKHDPIGPIEHGERLEKMLREAGADVRLSWAEAGHELVREDLDKAAAWLHGL